MLESHSHIRIHLIVDYESKFREYILILRNKHLFGFKTISTNCQKIVTIIYCYQYTPYLERYQLVSLLFGQVPSSAYLITDKDQENSFTPVHYAAMSGQAKVTKQLSYFSYDIPGILQLFHSLVMNEDILF